MPEWIYGRRAVVETLKSGLKIKKIVLSETSQASDREEIIKEARTRGVLVENVSRHSLDIMVRGNHQGVAADVEIAGPVSFKSFLDNLAVQSGTFVCLLDEVQDPQNLGAILRNAVCFGCSGVILPKWRSASLTPAVMKASSGALAYCPVAEISNLGVAMERLKEKGFTLYGADAGENTVSLEGLDIRRPAALVLGSEHAGIKPTLKKACDHLVRITQKSRIQSLNVASASAVFFHAFSLI